MNLLLLLSALLSAITGVEVGGVRAPVAAAQVARAGQVVAAVAATAVAPHRPVQGIAPLVAVSNAAVLPRIALSVPPLYASRRRE